MNGVSMRGQFTATLLELMDADPRLVLLLAGVGRYQFRQLFERYPDRCYDLGINEQALVGLAGGLAAGGCVPVLYGIAPFIVERAYEQIKLDLGLPGRPAVLATVGASYDYATEGITHHCPADVRLMLSVPGVSVLVPGHPAEVDSLLRQATNGDRPVYLRLSERANSEPHPLPIGQGATIQQGSKATVLAIGPVLDAVLEAADGLDVAVLYSPSVRPFPGIWGSRLLIVEPYYPALPARAAEFLPGAWVRGIGVLEKFIEDYGAPADLDRIAGLDPASIRAKILEIIA